MIKELNTILHSGKNINMLLYSYIYTHTPGYTCIHI